MSGTKQKSKSVGQVMFKLHLTYRHQLTAEESDDNGCSGAGPVEPLTISGALNWIEPMGTLFKRQDTA